MIKHSICAVAVAALTSFVAVDTSAQSAGPDPLEVHIESLSYNGSGCPADSVTWNVTSDARAFQLVFSEYFASVGPGVPITESHKNCHVRARLHVPQGWSYAVAAIDYRGYVGLDPRVRATQRSIYSFSSERGQGTLQSTFVGPLDEDYLFRDEVPLVSLVWSSCTETRDLHILTQVKVNNNRNRNGSGLITTDSIEGEVTQNVAIAWRRCP